jgi:hypothetical protein
VAKSGRAAGSGDVLVEQLPAHQDIDDALCALPSADMALAPARLFLGIGEDQSTKLNANRGDRHHLLRPKTFNRLLILFPPARFCAPA